MIDYSLPTTITVGGVDYAIRSDYRAILDIISAMNDPELDNAERALVLLQIFYVDCKEIPRADWQSAVNEALKFIGCGKEQNTDGARLVDWEQDFQYIIAPINVIAGKDVRGLDYLHWWSFVGYYGEISDKSTFSQIVRIRDAMRRGKMDKTDREWYNRNRDLVDLRTAYTSAEKDLLAKWSTKNG